MIPLPFPLPWRRKPQPVPETRDYKAALKRTERLDPVTLRPVWPLKRAGER